MLSVICPIYNEEKYISACIESIIEQDYPKDSLEILFIDGMSEDRTREIVAEYSATISYIRLIDNPARIVPVALNKAIAESCGDVIIRLDAHARYPTNYFSSLVKALNKYEADNVGAVCKTEVFNKTKKSQAIKAVLAHPLGVGNSIFRTGIDKVQEVDTVPFGCWKRSCFNKFGNFDERLIRNQDIEFNKRIKRGGGRIIIIPDTYSTYFAREDFTKLAKNNYNNGKWNILTVWYTHQFGSLSLRHFIPLFFILSLITPLILGLIIPLVAFLSIISFLIYSLTIIFVSGKLAIKNHLNWLYLFITFFILHISYGFGSLIGLIKLPFTKR